ncbi:MAG: sugar phosphate nucleotidyltransferase [Chloroflexota bacterium]|nr:sugar phosphate nucleotidyltransferase [Chloroflexota bacterium]
MIQGNTLQVVILAAGKGTRLAPLTQMRSKAMLPIVGVPMVERVMDQFAACGIEKFILVVNPQDREIVHYFERMSQFSGEIQFVQQVRQLGMGHALLCAMDYIEGDFMLSSCDNLVSVKHIQGMLSAWQTEPDLSGLLSLMPVAPEQVNSTGIVAWDSEWVTGIVEKPSPTEAPSNISSLPLYIFSGKILDYLIEIRPSQRGEYELQYAIQKLIEQYGRVYGVLTNRRLTLTTRADYLNINKHYLSSVGFISRSFLNNWNSSMRLNPPYYIESGTSIGDSSGIGPNVYIECDCRIGRNVWIKNAVIQRGSIIPDKCEIKNQIFCDINKC